MSYFAEFQCASDRHAHRGPQAAERALGERDVAAMAAGDVAGDGQAQARAALVLVARLFEPQEGFEDLLALAFRHARPVVIDVDGEVARLALRGDDDVFAETLGI